MRAFSVFKRSRPAARLALSERPILTGAVALVLYLALVPVGYLVWGALFDSRGLTLKYFHDAYQIYGLRSIAFQSLLFAAGSMLVAVGLGGAVAFLVVKTDMRLRRVVSACALLPLALPGVLYAFAWILLGGPHAGLIADVLGRSQFDVFSLGGMILVEGLHLSPVAFLLMAASLRSMDPELEEAAVASGARPTAVLLRVTSRLAAPALYACFLVTLVGALESFEVPVLIGIPARISVLTSLIWSAYDQLPAGLGEAGAYSCTLLVLTAAGVFLYWRLTDGGRRFEGVIGARFTPHRFSLGRWRGAALAASLAYLGVAAVLPLGMLVYCSLQPVYTGASINLATLTLTHYAEALGGGSLAAIENSLLLGLGCATIVMLIMSIVAWIVVRSQARGRWVLDVAASLPLVVPGLVVGVALLFVYLRSPIAVYGTLWILLIAYVTRFMPHGIRFASAAIRQLSRELEDAARTSGAGWWQTFRRVVLPLTAPGLAAGWALVFILSVLELSSSILLYPPGQEVIAVRMWEEIQEGQFAPPAATGVLLVAFVFAVLAAGWWLASRLRLRGLGGGLA